MVLGLGLRGSGVMPENVEKPSEDRKKFYIKKFVFYFIIFLAIFLVQRMFVELTFDGGYHKYWDPYNLLSHPAGDSNWEDEIPAPLYLATFFSCAIGSIIMDITQHNRWYINRIISEIVCFLAVLPTMLVILYSTSTLNVYTWVNIDFIREKVVLILLLCVQAGIVIGIIAQLLITKFKKPTQNNEEETEKEGIV